MRKSLSCAIQVMGLFCVATAQAAMTPNNPITLQTPQVYAVQWAASTSVQTLVTANANGTKVMALWCTCSGTCANDVQVILTRSSPATAIMAAASLATNGGTVSGTAGANLMTTSNWTGLPFESDGNPYFFLISGDVLKVKSPSSMAGTVSCFAVGGDF